MPDKVGRFQLYSDTSKYATGVWGVEQQSGFEEIKQRLQKPPV